MPRRRLQITLGRLGKTIALCAVAFALLRIPAGPILLIMVGVVLPGILIDRLKGRDGLVGGSVSGGLGFGVLGLILFVRDDLFRDPQFDLVMFLILYPLTITTGLIWGAAVSTALSFVFTNAGPTT